MSNSATKSDDRDLLAKLKDLQGVSIIICKNNDGTYALIKKDYLAKSGRQFYSSKIEPEVSPMLGALRALKKGKISGTPSLLLSLLYIDPKGATRMYIFYCERTIKNDKTTEEEILNLRKEEILESDNLTEMSRFAFMAYLKFEESLR